MNLSSSNQPSPIVTGGSRRLGFIVAKALKAAGQSIDYEQRSRSREKISKLCQPQLKSGAATAIWFATRNFEVGKDQTGLFWEDQVVILW